MSETLFDLVTSNKSERAWNLHIFCFAAIFVYDGHAMMTTPSVPKYLSFKRFQQMTTYEAKWVNLHFKICLYTSICCSPFKCRERQIFGNGGSSSFSVLSNVHMKPNPVYVLVAVCISIYRDSNASFFVSVFVLLHCLISRSVHH